MAKIIGIKMDWNKYLVLPAELVEKHLSKIIMNSVIIDTNKNEVVEGDGETTIRVFDSENIRGLETLGQVPELEELLKENYALKEKIADLTLELPALKG